LDFEDFNELKKKHAILLDKCESLQLDAKRMTAERDQILMSLREKEIDLMQKAESVNRLTKELERLREHLVEISDNYTREAIQIEQREKDLRMKLAEAEEANQEQNASIVNAKYVYWSSRICIDLIPPLCL
jgi:hypothetical protein